MVWWGFSPTPMFETGCGCCKENLSGWDGAIASSRYTVHHLLYRWRFKSQLCQIDKSSALTFTKMGKAEEENPFLELRLRLHRTFTVGMTSQGRLLGGVMEQKWTGKISKRDTCIPRLKKHINYFAPTKQSIQNLMLRCQSFSRYVRSIFFP